MKKPSLHVRIAKLNDGEAPRLGATADLSELLRVNNAREKMAKLEGEYTAMLEKIRTVKRKSGTNVISKWKLADAIFSFLQSAKRSNISLESHLKILCRDTSISRTEMKYLLRFRRTYSLKELDNKVPWSTYRSMLYHNPPYGKASK